jgi:hypothetical protein
MDFSTGILELDISNWEKNPVHQTRYFKLENWKNPVQIDRGIALHCKCLQGFTGGLQGNQGTGISNLQGLHVTYNPCNLFKGKTIIIVGNVIYRDTMGIPRTNCREKNASTMG